MPLATYTTSMPQANMHLYPVLIPVTVDPDVHDTIYACPLL